MFGPRYLSRATQNLHLSASQADSGQKMAKLPEVALACFSQLCNPSALGVLSRVPRLSLNKECTLQPTSWPGIDLHQELGEMRSTSPLLMGRPEVRYFPPLIHYVFITKYPRLGNWSSFLSVAVIKNIYIYIGQGQLRGAKVLFGYTSKSQSVTGAVDDRTQAGTRKETRKKCYSLIAL